MRTVITIVFAIIFSLGCAGSHEPGSTLEEGGGQAVAGEGATITAGESGMNVGFAGESGESGASGASGMGASGTGGAGGTSVTDAGVDVMEDHDASVVDGGDVEQDGAVDEEPDSGLTIECTFHVECEDNDPCTVDTCTDHVCSNSAEAAEGIACTDELAPDFFRNMGTCRSGACCAGCMDSVLGCIHADTQLNAAHCGMGGDSCDVCQGDQPYCSQGVCCASPVGCY